MRFQGLKNSFFSRFKCNNWQEYIKTPKVLCASEITQYNISQFYSLNIRRPTNRFPILDPQNSWIDEFYVVSKRCATDDKASKLWKGFNILIHGPLTTHPGQWGRYPCSCSWRTSLWRTRGRRSSRSWGRTCTRPPPSARRPDHPDGSRARR